MSDKANEINTDFEKLFESVFSNNPNAMWLSDNEGTLIRINKACENLVRVSAEETVGKYNVLQDKMVEEQGKMHLVRQVFDENKTVSFELYYDSSRNNFDWGNQVIINLDVTISPVLDGQGNLIHALIMHKDLTQQKAFEEKLIDEQQEKLRLAQRVIEEKVKAEQALEMDRLKSSFMSTATHEIRTPLTSIIGYIDLIENSPKWEIPQEIEEYFKVLKKNAKRLSVLIDNLLDMQRMESNRIDLNKTTVNIHELISTIEYELSPVYKEKNVTFNKKIEVKNKIKADENRLHQVIINLLTNALKFSQENAVISIHVIEEEDTVLFTVEDNGIGLTQKDIEKLFTPFPDITPTVPGKGSGLGLSISKGIVELHGGEIWVESEGINKGTKVSFKILKK